MVWKQPGISGVRNGGLPHPDMPGKLSAKAVEELPKTKAFPFHRRWRALAGDVADLLLLKAPINHGMTGKQSSRSNHAAWLVRWLDDIRLNCQSNICLA